MADLRALKGMNDVLPEEAGRWRALEETFRSWMVRYHYREIRTPLLESTKLFVRAVGETTDIVEKEMYSFVHRSEEMTLRPEGTAGAARAFVEHKVFASSPVTKWFYVGPMFRAERPQRGRLRQFWQLGCEVYGDPGPACDAEMIDMLGASVPLRGDAGDGGFSPAEVLNASPPEKPEADGATTIAGHFLLDILEPPPVDVDGYLPTGFPTHYSAISSAAQWVNRWRPRSSAPAM